MGKTFGLFTCIAQFIRQLTIVHLFSTMPETMEISDAAKSGDNTVENVGIKMTGSFQCPDCRQKFDTEKAKQLHWKFIHDPNRHQEDRVAGFAGASALEAGGLSSSAVWL